MKTVLGAHFRFRATELHDGYYNHSLQQFEVNRSTSKRMVFAVLFIELALLTIATNFNSGDLTLELELQISLRYIGVFLENALLLALSTNWRPNARLSHRTYEKLFGLFYTAILSHGTFNIAASMPVPPESGIYRGLCVGIKFFGLQLLLKSWYMKILMMLPPILQSAILWDQSLKSISTTMLLCLLLVIYVLSQESVQRSNFFKQCTKTKEDESFKKILSHLPSSVMLLNKQGQIKYTNRYLEHKFHLQDLSNSLTQFYDLKPRKSDAQGLGSSSEKSTKFLVIHIFYCSLTLSHIIEYGNVDDLTKTLLDL